MIYLLDANVFIQVKNLYYGFDFCPAFWEWLVEQNTSKRVFSTDKVADEIAAGDDDLKAWAQKRREGFFLMTDANVAAQFSKVSEWAGSSRRIKLPNVCAGLGLRCMNPYEMLRLENARFVLGESA